MKKSVQGRGVNLLLRVVDLGLLMSERNGMYCRSETPVVKVTTRDD